MTLMTASNSETTRRCDARCYEAKGQHCECVCHGKNHGVGLEKAVENVRAMVLEGLPDGVELSAAFVRHELDELQSGLAEVTPA